MTKRYDTKIKAICIALVVSLAMMAELLGWPPQVFAPACLAIFGASTLLQVVLRDRGASRLDHRRTN
jgi:hypothetical protein